MTAKFSGIPDPDCGMVGRTCQDLDLAKVEQKSEKGERRKKVAIRVLIEK